MLRGEQQVIPAIGQMWFLFLFRMITMCAWRVVFLGICISTLASFWTRGAIASY